jgi:hypothetical protein
MNHNLFRSSDATVSGVSTSDPLRRNTEVSEVPTVSTVVTSGSMEKSDPTITDVNPIVQVDPFNSTGESGVQYQTMEWW